VPSALVTGGSSGIGLAIARVLAEEGHELTLAARTVERLEEAAAELGALAVAADVSEEEGAVAAVAAHRERVGSLDLLVNASGVGFGGPLDGYPTKRFDITFGVNIRGMFLVTREALPLLKASRGRIVNLASIAGLQAEPGLAVYAATKHAVVGLSRALSEELFDDGVRVTALCPGFVDTPMAAWTELAPDELIRPEDCAELVRTLLRLSPAARIPVVVVERAGEDV
jgi:3-oxoacyl-[acyl-carrier protein] reductase